LAEFESASGVVGVTACNSVMSYNICEDDVEATMTCMTHFTYNGMDYSCDCEDSWCYEEVFTTTDNDDDDCWSWLS